MAGLFSLIIWTLDWPLQCDVSLCSCKSWPCFNFPLQGTAFLRLYTLKYSWKLCFHCNTWFSLNKPSERQNGWPLLLCLWASKKGSNNCAIFLALNRLNKEGYCEVYVRYDEYPVLRRKEKPGREATFWLAYHPTFCPPSQPRDKAESGKGGGRWWCICHPLWLTDHADNRQYPAPL